MMHKPAVSVIIPTWNRAQLIEKAIKSALNQTLSPLEVLVCDDGSTDDTDGIVYSIGDERVKWLAGEHSGRPAIPRNRGIKAARGEWLAFLDSDDEWMPEKLEKQLAFAMEAGSKAVCSNAFRLLPGKNTDGCLIECEKERITFNDLLPINLVICSSSVIHQSVLRVAEGFPESTFLKTGQDYALWLRVSSMEPFAFLDEPLVVYRDDPSNGVRGRGPGYWPQRAYVMDNFIGWGIKQNIHGDMLKRARREYFIAMAHSYKLKARDLVLRFKQKVM